MEAFRAGPTSIARNASPDQLIRPSELPVDASRGSVAADRTDITRLGKRLPVFGNPAEPLEPPLAELNDDPVEAVRRHIELGAVDGLAV